PLGRAYRQVSLKLISCRASPSVRASPGILSCRIWSASARGTGAPRHDARSWAALWELGSARRSPIGFKPFADACIEQGALDEAASVSLSELEALAGDPEQLKAKLLALETVLDDVPVLEIETSDAAALRQGREIVLLPHTVEHWRAAAADFDSGRLALARCDETAIALGDVRAGRFQPKKVFQL
ncbi:MAG: hypothetical protein VXW22_09310, partial [Pseudomonadota bacterium]|nr:hypothetical protein [Pseudomonadota bacterium]